MEQQYKPDEIQSQIRHDAESQKDNHNLISSPSSAFQSQQISETIIDSPTKKGKKLTQLQKAVKKVNISNQLMSQSPNGQKTHTPPVDWELKYQRIKRVFSPQELQRVLRPADNEKQYLNDFFEDIQPKMDSTVVELLDYIDRKYIFLVNNLKKIYQKMESYVEKLKQYGQNIEQNDQFNRLTQETKDFKEFSLNLKQDILILEASIMREEQKNSTLTEIMQKQYDYLKQINFQNVKISENITTLSTKLKQHKKRTKSKEEQESDQLAALFSQRNTISSISDPVKKIELYCGSQKKPVVKQSQIINSYIKKQQALLNTEPSQSTSKNVQYSKHDLINKIQTQPNQKVITELSHYTSVGQLLTEKEQLINSNILHNNNILQQLDQSSILDNLKSEEDLFYSLKGFTNKNKNLKRKIIHQSNNFFEIYKLFEDCLDIEKKYLEKLQKVVVKSDGLKGSMLFDMKQTEHNSKDYKLMQHRGSNSKLQGREVTNLIHDTLKNMWVEKFVSKKKVVNIQVDWETFQQFTPIQLVGMMSMKPDIFTNIKSIMENKARMIRQQTSKNKSLNTSILLTDSINNTQISVQKNLTQGNDETAFINNNISNTNKNQDTNLNYYSRNNSVQIITHRKLQL